MLYFAYGANTNRHEMSYRCPGAVYLGNAVLPAHELVFRAVADIRPPATHNVAGALWDIDEPALAALDHFEGYPRLYNRREFVVHRYGKNENPRALAYFMTAGRAITPPHASYLDVLIEGYSDCQLPADQLSRAVKHACANDSEAHYPSLQWA